MRCLPTATLMQTQIKKTLSEKNDQKNMDTSNSSIFLKGVWQAQSKWA